MLLPPASSGAESAEEVCPRRAEGQAAHTETLRARPNRGSQEGCADPTSGIPRPYNWVLYSNGFSHVL